MKEGITILSESSTDNLILFIHGFTGNSDTTWGSIESGFPKMLSHNDDIAKLFDIGVFEYYSRLTETKVLFDNVLSFKKNKKINKNLAIEDLQELLKTQLQITEKSYKQIIIVAHSMGGLVSKCFILNDLIKGKECPVKLFISLAVPHQGSELATFGSLLSSNIQISDLRPLNETINKINEEWIKVKDRVPNSKYLYGTNDCVVKKNSAIQLGADYDNVHAINADHGSISCPENNSSDVFKIVCKLIKQELFDKPVCSLDNIPEETKNGKNVIKNNCSNISVDKNHNYKKSLFSLDMIVNTLVKRESDTQKKITDEIEQDFLNKNFGAIYRVDGEPGTGKTIAVQALASYVEHWTAQNDIETKIFIFDLMSYEKKCAEGSLEEDVLKELLYSAEEVLHSAECLLIIDGLDYLNPLTEKFTRHIHPCLNKNICVFFKRYYKGVAIKSDDEIIDKISPNSYFKCGLDDSDFHGGESSFVFKLLCEIMAVTPEQLSNTLEKMKEWFFENRYNLRLISLIIKESNSSHNSNSSFEFLAHFLSSYLRSYPYIKNPKTTQEKAEEIGYKILTKGERNLDFLPIKALIKRISTQSFEMLGYLSARYICGEILRIGDSITCGNNSCNLSHIDAVYPFLINKYAKQIVTQDESTQRRYLTAIEKIYPLASLRLQAFMCYLLGRLYFLKEDCKKFLLSCKKKIDMQKAVLKNPIPNNELLILHRTIYISLIYLVGSYEKEYIKGIMSDKNLDAINRGFHRHYYGDGSYIIDRDMVSPDKDLGHFRNTYRQLSIKITNHTNQTEGILNLSAFTILSLVLSRLQNGTLEHTVSNSDTLKLINQMSEINLLKVVKDYATSVAVYLKSDMPPITESLRMMYQLKHQLRNGWNYKSKDNLYDRTVPKAESVSEHTDFAVRLAQVFLPENEQVKKLVEKEELDSEYTDYDKCKIISMLSIHDLGEYLYGDIVRMEQKDIDIEREHCALKTLSSTTACHTSPLLADPYISIYSPWREHNSPSNIMINHKISHDIDKLECLIQLYLYAENPDCKIKDLERFSEDLINTIKTDIGKEIFKIAISPMVHKFKKK